MKNARICDKVRSHLIDALWERSISDLERLNPQIQTHLQKCQKCKKFWNDLVAMHKMFSKVELRIQPNVEAISKAVTSAMEQMVIEQVESDETLTSAEKHKLAERKPTISWPEKIGFLLLATLGVLFQGFLLSCFKPSGFLVFNIGFNWLTPFVFYFIYRLDRRSLRSQKKEAVR